MDLNQLYTILKGTFSDQLEQRNQSESILKQIENSAGYPSSIFQLIQMENVELGVKQAAVIHLKHLVHRHWSPMNSNVWGFTENDKEFMKQNIFSSFTNHHLIRIQLGEILNNMYNSEYPENWSSALGIIVQYISSNDLPKIYAGLYCLRILLKTYEFTDADGGKRNHVFEIVGQTFPIIFNIFDSLLKNNDVNSFELIVLILKNFWYGTQFKIPPYLLEAKNANLWFSKFVTLFGKDIPPNTGNVEKYPPLTALKWLCMLIAKLFPRNVDDNLSKKEEQFGKLFMDNYSLKFLDASFKFLSKYATVENTSHVTKKISQHCLDFISECSSKSFTWKTIKGHISNFFKSILLPVLSMDKYKLELFNEEPKDFIRYEYDLELESIDPRIVVIEFLTTTVKNRGKEVLNIIMGVVSEVFQNFSANPEQFAILKDAALLVFGTLEDNLRTNPNYSNILENIIYTHIIPDMNSKFNFLRAKAIWTFSKFWAFEFHDENKFNQALQLVFQGLSDNSLPVRYQASLAVSLLSRTPQANLKIEQCLPSLFTSYFKLVEELDNEDVVNSMTELVLNYPNSIPPLAIDLTKNLVIASQNVIEKEINQKKANENDLSNLDVGIHLLRVIQTVLYSVKSIPDITIAIEPTIIPLLLSINNTLIDYFDDLIEIFTIISDTVDVITPSMWLVFEKFCDATINYAPDHISDLLSALDNCIFKGKDYFVSKKEYLDLVCKLYSNTFNSERTSDRDRGEAAKLMEVVFLNCKGQVDQIVPPVIEIALNAFSKAKYQNYKILLLEIVINSLHYNPKITLSFLESKGWTNLFFNEWFQLLGQFQRLHDLKLSIVSLSSIFLLPFSELPNSIKEKIKTIFTTIMELNIKFQVAESEFLEKPDDIDDNEGMFDDDIDAKVFNDDEDVDFDISSIIAKIRNNQPADDQDDNDDDLFKLEPDEEFSTPLTPIDPAVFFIDTLKIFADRDAKLFGDLVNSLNKNEKEALESLKNYRNSV